MLRIDPNERQIPAAFGDLEEVDAAPIAVTESAANEIQSVAKSVAERWRAIAQEVVTFNDALAAAGLEKIKAP